MSFRPAPRSLIFAGVAIAASALIPATVEFASEASWATPPSPAPIAVSTPDAARAALLAPQTAPAETATGFEQPAPVPSASTEIDDELACMAKIVHHEAGNQSREGQLAVAQLIMNRVESGRFASTICGVANQRGQFFDTDSYSPRHDARWDMAVDVSREARDGRTPDVVPGALFYHAAYQAPPRFFRSRPRVMTLGDHVFYR